jgi:hypothetical protein
MTVRMKLGALVSLVSVGLVACAAPEGDTVAAEDDDLNKQAAYEYTCNNDSPTVLEKKSFKLTVADGHMRFDDAYGENTGARDRSYKSPKNTSRARYTGFGWGDDCDFKMVVDAAAFSGKSSIELRAQCASDDEFRQDVFSCKSPKKTRLSIKPPTPITPPPITGPAANTKKWSCSATGDDSFASTLGLQVTADAIRISGEFDWEGSRDKSYKSRSGANMGFDNFDYGGDCELTAVVEAKILEANATSASLKVRCRADDFQQYAYSCKPQ